LHLFVLAQSTCTGCATFLLPAFHFLAETGDFSVLRKVKTDSGVHPASFPFNWYRIPYPGIQQARRDLHHLLPSGGEFKNECSYTAVPSIHTSHALRGFAVRGWANSQGRPKVKSISLESFSGQERRNCSATPPGLRDKPRDVRAMEGKTRSSSNHDVSAEKRTLKILNFFWGGGGG